MRLNRNWVFGAAAVAAVAVALSPALGGEGATPTFSIGDGEGPAGGEAGVTLSLDNDDGAAVSVGVDIEFNDTDLTFTPPVSSGCTIDPRIASTHQIAGRILEPGVLNIEILVAGTPDPLPPLGNGALATCDFTIRGDAQVGDMFPLAATNVFVGDALGGEIPSETDDGVITVTDALTPTPSPTGTNGTTPTEEPTVPVDTPTIEPTLPVDTPTVDPTDPVATSTPTPDTSTPTPQGTPGETTFSLGVEPASQTGVPGGSAAIQVVLSSDPSGEAADSVANTLAVDEGLALTACSVAAEIPGSIEGVPGSTAAATLGDGEGSVPSGTVYSCSVSIAQGASGSLGVDCSGATVNGEEIACTGGTIVVSAPPTPTVVPPTATPTNTALPPTSTPTNTPVLDFDDDGCAVGPVAQTGSPLANLLFVLVPAALLWRRRK